jgi:uncharacterized protein (DUF433 family)
MGVQVPDTIDLRKYIDTQFFGERPHVRGRRVPIATIAYNARTHHWSVAEAAHNFGLSERQVLAALLHYAEHQDEIDEQEAAYQAELDEAYRLYGKPG